MSQARKTAHVPAGHTNGGQFTGPGGNPPSGSIKPKRQRKRKASAPQRPVLAEYQNQKALERMNRPRPPTSPMDRRNRARQYAEYHQEIEYDLANALRMIDDSVKDGSWTPEEAKRYRAQARAKATREHKQVPGWEKPKAAPKPKRPRKGEPGYVPPVRKPRAPKASAPARDLYGGPMTEAEAIADYNAAIARYGAELPADAEKRLRALRDRRIRAARKAAKPSVPRQGRRTRRNTQQREAVYSEARRGLRNRRARGG